ncbi:P-loop containing nucleoside triphosphate hydrolase protein [Dothidotthia symphoricarpi CBS 119687]|uniref:P-loop containing nucleoside triphosphate hydrolase protein n=1 Tax=Dothidotthia symphoricarpi CBS 119687 TaxID=1392245 RepID=A0A6A6AM67_9PLEO|nr:P-loop containing nucleoside triphosphate hydrolase protein [Dothidotthia symphoricarpi CBS 119687]KAF2132185.1 P-loop containing nucleoside triphosphate hydrolase protein [Dothidotthia symphoricarpi CBS 119687]
MTGSSSTAQSREDWVSREYFHHSSAQRVNTDIVLVEALRKQYPDLELVVVPEGSINLIAYASAGFATATPLQDAVRDPIYGPGVSWRAYAPPARRLDGKSGVMVESVIFGKYAYKWNDEDFILYIADGRDGGSSYPSVTNHYLLTSSTHKVDELIKEATHWGHELHDEVWVFDQGYWQKSRELWNSVQKSTWDNVILDEEMKNALITDVENFFDSQDTYQKLKVPWKRGVIYYGPPGNGKTISIKALMRSLYQRGSEEGDSRLSVPTLYVRTLVSYGGPEFSINQIFSKARQQAPCFLVFEDIDSLINDSVRSYFLNAVDGLQSNDGILMVGSTNHLDRLDPGIAKRPSRFDRKYYFPDPNFDERVQYAKFWQGKLEDNKDLDFPDKLCSKIAEITDKFSFAYMQEAFVASLLAIAARGGKDEDVMEGEKHHWAGHMDPLTNAEQMAWVDRFDRETEKPDAEVDSLELWKEMQKQVKILKEEIKEDGAPDKTMAAAPAMPSSLPHRASKGDGAFRFRNELGAMLGNERQSSRSAATDFWGANRD